MRQIAQLRRAPRATLAAGVALASDIYTTLIANNWPDEIASYGAIAAWQIAATASVGVEIDQIRFYASHGKRMT